MLIIKTLAPLCWFVFVSLLFVFFFVILIGSFIDLKSSTSTNGLTNNPKTSCGETEAGCGLPLSFTSVSVQSNVGSTLLIKLVMCRFCANLGCIILPRTEMTIEQAAHRLSGALQGN